MEYRYFNFAVFFSGLLLISYLIFPGQFDMVAIYRNSYLYNQALTLLDKLESQRPQNTRIDLERANVLYLAGRYDDSLNLLRGITVREPDNENAWRRLARSYRVLQRPRDAMLAFEHVVAISPRDSLALHLLDEYYRWFQLPDREAQNLERLTQRFPDDRDQWDRLYALHLRTGRIDQAVLLLRDMADRFEDKLDIELTIGQLLMQKGDPEAIEVFARAHDAYPDRDDIADELIDALVRTQEADRAADVYRTHYSVSRSRLEILDGIADLYRSAGLELRAAETLAQKLELSTSVAVRVEVAAAFEDAGASAFALPHARALVESDPASQDHHTRLIRILETLALRFDLVTALERYVQLWPNDLRALLRLADARNWVEDYTGEAEVLETYLLQRPGDRQVEGRLADAYIASGMSLEALPRLRRLLAANPTDQDTRNRFYGVLAAVGPVNTLVSDAERLNRHTGTTEASRNGLFLADTYFAHGMRDPAVNGYALLSRMDTPPVFRTTVGRRLLDAGAESEARIAFESALDSSPGLVAAHEGLADALAGMEPMAALSHLDQVDRLSPGKAETAYRRGAIHEAAQDTALYTRHYGRFLERTEGSVADNAYFLRQRAHALYRTGDPDRALEVLVSSGRAYPEEVEIVNDTAAILIDLKRYDEALSLLKTLEQKGTP